MLSPSANPGRGLGKGRNPANCFHKPPSDTADTLLFFVRVRVNLPGKLGLNNSDFGKGCPQLCQCCQLLLTQDKHTQKTRLAARHTAHPGPTETCSGGPPARNGGAARPAGADGVPGRRRGELPASVRAAVRLGRRDGRRRAGLRRLQQ